MVDRLLKIDAVAKILSLSKRTIHRLNCTGKMPCPVRINGSLRYRESDIERWIDLGCPDRKTFELRKAS